MEELLLELIDEGLLCRLDDLPGMREDSNRIAKLLAELRESLPPAQRERFEELNEIKFRRERRSIAYAFLLGLRIYI